MDPKKWTPVVGLLLLFFSFQTAIAAFLIMFSTPSLAEMDQNKLLNGTHEDRSPSVHISGSIALIHDTNPWSECDIILDYNHGYLAAKLFSKKACVLTRMDKVIFPSLETFHKALDKQLPRNYHSSQGLTYIILPRRVKNVAQYGKTISDLCRGVPTYFAQQCVEGTALELNPQSCFKGQILASMYSFGISICGEIPGL
ncbi:gastrokine-3-like [Dromiciops gliroides]|uniref:gastrokine-3-like n=1 Tax=Dromiciops gliroides TaxID=33562 RepID=UPI001CC7B7CF|nr:gastrokine-3-like [Dromiciops gliroides]